MEAIYNFLKEHHYQLATAESCTGGLLGATLTSIPGISAVYGYGLITYSNEAKMKLLGVDPLILETYGAVSKETAKAMAEGLFTLSAADYAIAITGIAGPDGGTEAKPVGLVYFGLHYQGKLRIEKKNFDGDRQTIRQKAVDFALLLLREAMEAEK